MVPADITSLPYLERSSIAERIMSPWRCAIAFIDSTAVVEAVVMAAKFLRPVSTIDSTFTVGSLNSPAILLKSKSAKGFLKAVLAYIGISWDIRVLKLTHRQCLCCGAQRRLK